MNSSRILIRVILFLVIFAPVLRVEAQEGGGVHGKFKPCDEVLNPNNRQASDLLSSTAKVMSYAEAKAYVKEKDFGEIAKFWAWTRSNERPLNFPRDPDFYYSEWASEGGILSFLNIGSNGTQLESFEFLMEQLSDKLGGMEEAREHIIQIFVKYKVNLSNSPMKRRQHEELSSIPSYATFLKHDPKLIEKVRSSLRSKPWKTFAQFLNGLKETHGSYEVAINYIINLFVEHDISGRNFSLKKETIPEIKDFPSFDSFQNYLPEVIEEIQRRRGKIKPRKAKEFFKKLEEAHGGRAGARAYIVRLLVEHDVNKENFLILRSKVPELTKFPSYSSLSRYDSKMMKEVKMMQDKKRKQQEVKEYMEKLAKKKGSMKNARAHIVELYAKLGVTNRNFRKEKKKHPELAKLFSPLWFSLYDETIMNEVLRKQEGTKPVNIKKFFESISKEHGGEKQAEEYMISFFVENRITDANYAQKKEELPELDKYPSYSGLRKAVPHIIDQIIERREDVQKRIYVEPFMEQLAKDKGGIEEAEKYLVDLFVKHGINQINFTRKSKEIPELSRLRLPHFSSLSRQRPEIIRAVIRRRIEQARK